jgi:hypothetical protein
MEPIDTIVESWQVGLAEFYEVSRRFHIYK